MTNTRHGHHIPNSPEVPGPNARARCGGVTRCRGCKEDIATFLENRGSDSTNLLSSIGVATYSRISFDVEAVLVQVDKLQSIAIWCNGSIHFEDNGSGLQVPYIKVNVVRPPSERQTKAFVGDYIVYTNSGFRIYTESAFQRTFLPKKAVSA